MVELRGDELTFSFPEIHEHAVCSLEFQRTLRIPDDDGEHFLPPGLGAFPLHHVDDYTDRVPDGWRQHGGVFMPMYQAEALWLRIRAHTRYPMAVMVAAGKVDALTGEPFSNALTAKPQNYLVTPDQPWLDGFCVEKGLVRQFVAMPLGEGYTAEEQLTGAAEHGGLQIVVYPMKAARYEAKLLEERRAFEKAQEEKRRAFEKALEDERRAFEKALEEGRDWWLWPHGALDGPVMYAANTFGPPVESMGLAPGGRMRQELYKDQYGFEAWEQTVRSRCFVHLLNSAQYRTVTGYAPPHEPPTAADYTKAGLPWFDYYDADRTALEGAQRLAGLDSVAARQARQGKPALDAGSSVQPGPEQVQRLAPKRRRTIREGAF